jgi:hypothetical protein
MKRKTNLMLVIFLMVTFMAATLPVSGSAEEYKVMKPLKRSHGLNWK